MREELAPHEGVVALGVITRKVDVPRKRTSNQEEERILVHVEGDDVLEGDLTVLVHLNEVLDVDRDRGAFVGWISKEEKIGLKKRRYLVDANGRGTSGET